MIEQNSLVRIIRELQRLSHLEGMQTMDQTIVSEEKGS